jgi:hypothetical protein
MTCCFLPPFAPDLAVVTLTTLGGGSPERGRLKVMQRDVTLPLASRLAAGNYRAPEASRVVAAIAEGSRA